jgi:hypothetical protein
MCLALGLLGKNRLDRTVRQLQADCPDANGGQSGLSSQSPNSLSNLLILIQILPIPQNSKFMMNP